MELRINQDALGLGAYQAALAVVATLVLAWLVWRAARAVIIRSRNKSKLTQREFINFVGPPFGWLVAMIVVAIVFSTYQTYGPRIAIPKTDLAPIGTESPTPGPVHDLSPRQLTDEQRLEQQRGLERETRERVDLPK